MFLGLAPSRQMSHNLMDVSSLLDPLSSILILGFNSEQIDFSKSPRISFLLSLLGQSLCSGRIPSWEISYHFRDVSAPIHLFVALDLSGLCVRQRLLVERCYSPDVSATTTWFYCLSQGICFFGLTPSWHISCDLNGVSAIVVTLYCLSLGNMCSPLIAYWGIASVMKGVLAVFISVPLPPTAS